MGGMGMGGFAMSPAPMASMAPPAAQGQKQCDFWTRMGSCRHGENCKFAHIGPGGSGGDAAPMKETYGTGSFQAGKKDKVCDFWARTGSCKHGDSCKFLHSTPTSSGMAYGGFDQGMMGGMMMPPMPVMPSMAMPAMPNADAEAMKAYAAQAQELANQYAAQAQALSQQANNGQPDNSALMGGSDGMGGMLSSPMGMMPMMADYGMSAMPGAQQYAQAMPGAQQYAQAMPGAQTQAMMYMQGTGAGSMEPQAKRKRPGSYTPDGTRICDFFLRDGSCRHGVNCKFSHQKPAGADDLGSVPMASVYDGMPPSTVAIGEAQEGRGLKRPAEQF